MARQGRGRLSTTLPVGYAPADAVLLGEEDATQLRVRVLKVPEGSGLKVGQAAWVKGDKVADLIRDGHLHDISATAQKARLWRVGNFTYTSYAEAERVGKAMNQTPIEVA